jgi:hypothetical protein
MAATFTPYLKKGHTFRLDYWIHLRVSNGFDCVLIVVDHMTRVAHFQPCTISVA